MPKLIKEGILEINKNANIKIILNEVEALKVALNEASGGDIIIVFFEKFKPLVEFIESIQEDDTNLGNVVNSN